MPPGEMDTIEQRHGFPHLPWDIARLVVRTYKKEEGEKSKMPSFLPEVVNYASYTHSAQNKTHTEKRWNTV